MDDEGRGQSTVVPLKITLLDNNDNPPVFPRDIYRAVIDEGATKFDPPLQVEVHFICYTRTVSVPQGCMFASKISMEFY